jgi:hypothetical protein
MIRFDGRSTAAAAALACAALTSGCGTVATKEVVSNSAEYLGQNFTPEQVSPQHRTTIERGQPIPARSRASA